MTRRMPSLSDTRCHPGKDEKECYHDRARATGDHSLRAVWSARPGATRGAPPRGLVEHVGLLSCSEMCRELLQTMGLIPEE